MSDVGEKVYRIPLLKFTLIGGGKLLRVETPAGSFVIEPREEDVFWVMHSQKPFDTRVATSMVEAKEVAQAWYVERMVQGLEEVPKTGSFPTASAEEAYIEGWLDGNDHMALADDVDRRAVAGRVKKALREDARNE